MFEHLQRDARTLLQEARDEAQRSGARLLEAEHLLLVLSRRSDLPAGRVLHEAGLDPDSVRRALELQTQQSLAAVGIDASVFHLGPPTPVPTPRFGTSAKRAIQRGLEAAKERRDRYVLPLHLLIGVLLAHEGTVPRALRAAGVDQSELLMRSIAALPASP